MTTWLRSLAVMAAAALCGCGPGYTFQPWMGAQQNWTTSPGAYVRLVDGIPLYSPGQYPPRPYLILGAVTTDSEGNLAKAAHEQHADAVLLSSEFVHQGEVWVAEPGMVVPAGRHAFVALPPTATAVPTESRTFTANLIKYK